MLIHELTTSETRIAEAPFEKIINDLNKEIVQKISADATVRLSLMDDSVAREIFKPHIPQASNLFIDYIFKFKEESKRARIGYASYSMGFPIYMKSSISFNWKDSNSITDVVSINNQQELNEYIIAMFNCDYMKKLFILTKKQDL